MSTSFTLKMVIDQKSTEIDYESAERLERDTGLQALFTDDLVSKCEAFHANGKRAFGLPFMEWDRLVAEVQFKFGDHTMTGGRR